MTYQVDEYRTWDIAIIGAGAAGLAAGIFAAETARASNHALRIILLDSAKKIGAKILISGGGRCNVTHDSISPDDFNGSRNIVRNVLAAFDEQATVRWFEALGVPLKREDTGKLFPISDKAHTVLDALLRRCTALGIDLFTRHKVQDVIPPQDSPHPLSPTRGTTVKDNYFLLQHEGGSLQARRVIMATGGRSLPKTGSDGSGWTLVSRLGHTVTETYPALVPLVLRKELFHEELSGMSLPVELSTFAAGKRVDRRSGHLLWTHFGVSGPVVMDASRHWISAQANRQTAELRCNFLPGQSFEQVEKTFMDAAALRPRLSLGRLLGEQFPDRFAVALIRWASMDPTMALSVLRREGRRRLVHALTNFLLPVEQERGWNFAEVTAGGVPLHEIDYRTMASRIVPGLYLAGEMLDCDGRIGGFNFQWAWSTGRLAGRAAAR